MTEVGPGWLIDEQGYPVPKEMSYCPYCFSYEAISEGFSMTQVGYFGGTMADPNHYTETRYCRECDKYWMRAWVPKSRSVWLASNDWVKHPDGRSFRLLLAGQAGCCRHQYIEQQDLP